MIAYLDPLYRPPAEALSVILQVTYGCSYNECTFCSMYTTKGFKQRNLDDLFIEIDFLSKQNPLATKVFLADGDALVLQTSVLLKILIYLQKKFISLRRVSLYATTQNIQNKSQEDLLMLKQNKLSLMYIGIESGHDTILKKIKKGVNSQEIIAALNKLSDADIKISATIILGIGGIAYTSVHAKHTANIVNNSKINYLSTLQLGLDDTIKQRFYNSFDDFIAQNDYEILNEQKMFLENIEAKNKIIFRSNHASNSLHLKGILPRDKDKLIAQLNMSNILKDEIIIPNKYRGF